MRRVESTDELQEYMERHLAPRDKVLARLEDEAHRENIPIVDPHEGMLLYLLVRIAGAKRILELGTATGYSGIWMLRGSDGGSLTTFELDPARAARARANFSDAGLGEKLEARFDACFIDLINSFRSEEITRRVLDLVLERLDPGALLMTDNTLQQGDVLHPESQNVRNAAHYNDVVAKHPRLESVLIPIRDGLSVARVKD
jgi:caffeoyl-CoA O-methyltransferase